MKDLWPVLLQYGLPALLGLIAGVVGSLVAPWAQWSVEKRRLRLERRRHLLDDVRNEFRHRPLGSFLKMESIAAYPRLRLYLRAEVREALEAPRPENETTAEENDETMRRIDILEAEMARLEREWRIL
jgi:hypothetical protein